MEHTKTRDCRLLETVADLERICPEWLLQDICKQLDVEASIRDVEPGRFLPIDVKTELERRYKRIMMVETEIATKCIEASKGLLPLAVKCFAVCLAVLGVVGFLSSSF